jgi:hypothetical protein
MTVRHHPSILAPLCAIAALCGCSATLAPQSPQYTTKFTVENTDQFMALDSGTEAAVSCTGLQERTLPDGRLEVVANVKNRGAGALRVQAQCLFLDEQGVPVDASPPWQTLSIAADSTAVVRFTAPGLSARRYSIRVRAAR